MPEESFCRLCGGPLPPPSPLGGRPRITHPECWAAYRHLRDKNIRQLDAARAALDEAEAALDVLPADLPQADARAQLGRARAALDRQPVDPSDAQCWAWRMAHPDRAYRPATPLPPAQARRAPRAGRRRKTRGGES